MESDDGELFDSLSENSLTSNDHRREEDNKESNGKSSRDRNRDRDHRDRDYRDYKHSKGRDDRRWSKERRKSRDSSSHGRHDKRRYTHKRTHRRHSSSDSRSSSRSRRRSRRSRSRSYDSYASSNDSRADYSERGNQDRTHDSYKHQPNSTVMVRGLASHLTEQDIRQDILQCGIMVKDIRLIRHRDTGASRGFAFVEFQTVQEATRWMDMKMGALVLQDEYHATLIYSVPKVPYNEKTKIVMSDWYCIKCQGHNFKRREFCYKCHNPRPDDQDPELSEELSSHPTNTIILYNLDALTTEEGILQAFKGRPSLASIPIRSVRIAREAVTNLSRGMCYVETNNVTDSVRLYTLLTDETLTVDSRQAGVAYSKPASHGTNHSVAATALAAAQWTNNDNKSQIMDENSIESMAQYSASLYAKTSEEHATYLEYYRDYYRNQQNTESDKTPGTSQDSGVACSSQSSASQSSSVIKSSSGSFASDTRTEEKKTVHATISSVPVDTSTYQYDEASGYYYDPVSGLYYDATTQYFYDSTKQQFLYWNTEQGKYVVVSDTLGSSSQNSESSKKSSNDKKKEKKPSQKEDKVKVAKKIAKDMEKWAKTLNQKKDGTNKFQAAYEATNTNYVPYYTEPSTSSTSAVAESDSLYGYRTDSYIKPSTSSQDSAAKVPLVAPYGDESDSDDDSRNVSSSYPTPSVFIPESLIDFQKLACLLCKRQFPNKEVLEKHTKLSELHKKNLEELKKSNYNNSSSLESSSNYRDRAKERRMKFGSDPSDGRNTLKDLYIQTKNNSSLNYTEEPTKDGLKQDNIGNRMLQKMGWTEGQGLGRDGSGRTTIITTERRAANAGLGLRGVPVVDEGDDRYGRARKLTLARYQELEDV